MSSRVFCLEGEDWKVHSRRGIKTAAQWGKRQAYHTTGCMPPRKAGYMSDVNRVNCYLGGKKKVPVPSGWIFKFAPRGRSIDPDPFGPLNYWLLQRVFGALDSFILSKSTYVGQISGWGTLICRGVHVDCQIPCRRRSFTKHGWLLWINHTCYVSTVITGDKRCANREKNKRKPETSRMSVAEKKPLP